MLHRYQTSTGSRVKLACDPVLIWCLRHIQCSNNMLLIHWHGYLDSSVDAQTNKKRIGTAKRIPPQEDDKGITLIITQTRWRPLAPYAMCHVLNPRSDTFCPEKPVDMLCLSILGCEKRTLLHGNESTVVVYLFLGAYWDHMPNKRSPPQHMVEGLCDRKAANKPEWNRTLNRLPT